MAYLHSIAREVPAFSVSNEEAAAILEPTFREAGEDLELLRQIFRNAAIDRRYLARPPEFYGETRDLTTRNRVYHEVASELGTRASARAIEAAGLKPEDIDHVIDTSCTGVMIPALNAVIANNLGLRSDIRRTPLTEVGCAGGAVAIARARDFITAYPGANVLCVCTELPSLTVQLGDTSRANLVSSAIFGDGCAAFVVTGEAPAEAPAFEVLDSASHLFPNTAEVMGFDLRTEGFKIILSPRIPILVKRHLRPLVDAFLAKRGLTTADLSFFALHPGGTKVLDNLRDVLDLEEDDVTDSRKALREYGNLSSASVMYVADEILQRAAFPDGGYGLLAAMGPGFALEMSLLSGRNPR